MNHYQTIAATLAYLRENALKQPNLSELAEQACMSPFHFQRVFTEWAGVSPKKFLQFLTLQHAKSLLTKTSNLAEVSEACGLSSTSRIHDLFVSLACVTPGTFKAMGRDLQIQYALHTCQFGDYLVAATDKGICYLHFYQTEDEALNDLRNTWPEATIQHRENAYHAQVQAFFRNAGLQPGKKLSLHLQGTPFQVKVWEALLRIPEGHLSSYAGLAQRIGKPGASRAVGTAIGSNPVAFLIPCHRVVKSMGGIGEYRWGPARKMAMIGWEAAKNSEPNTLELEQLSMF